MTKIIVMLTCFNRKDKTINCINTLVNGNKNVEFHFFICDDSSSDGTPEELRRYDNVTLLSGDGNSFYTGGMRIAIGTAQKSTEFYDYVMLINDDVSFFDNAVEKLVDTLIRKNADVIVGCTCDEDNKLTYGGVTYPDKSLKYEKHGPGEEVKCDTFHANCVLMKKDTFLEAGNMDECYHHSLGDFDYGLTISRAGRKIYVSDSFVGICLPNSSKSTWADTSLSRIERIKKKESYKGVPSKEWFHYVHKNFGLLLAMRAVVTPYIRILIKR